jgi:hypothetical protein
MRRAPAKPWRRNFRLGQQPLERAWKRMQDIVEQTLVDANHLHTFRA